MTDAYLHGVEVVELKTASRSITTASAPNPSLASASRARAVRSAAGTPANHNATRNR